MRQLYYSCAAVALFAVAAAGPAFAQDKAKLTQQQVKCETAFTKVNADGNGLISKEEADDAIDRSFAQLDFDNDGRVTQAEYSACHKYSELYAETTNAFEWMQQAGQDQDKSVSKEEMAAASQRDFEEAQNDSAKNGTTKNGMTKEEHARQTAWNFRKLDKNNNGTIDFSEWRGTPVAEDVLPADRNQDQAADPDEWRAHMEEGQAKAQKANQSQAAASNGQADEEPTVWLHYLYIY